ncbi:response regulator transcription factor [Actinosynnema sp. NPDC047251]|uniref:Transcriptional regulator n=1 Tax=Saccharothrix espanaensis (strain ATCC 51144 / DSM 44229 / JCM 9112 / NBRC 15066 / NRRL 15764) TaxID=1179773 RepID=K0JRK1_SACES|nr:response regulator transcription factor [Saccharothrix espanaensis]CCH27997.1 Transcriptional regulator [Saccharothrix espanaensis DSM 44229]
MNETGRVLVVDDDVTVRDVVRRYLELAGHQVELVGDGEHALRRVAEREPDLVVLDLMLPGIDGLEVCRRLRARSAVPVVMLTALGEEEDRIAGLQLGADDYVTKPFSPRELALRVTSVLRRSRVVADRGTPALVDGGLRVDVGARSASLDGRELSLTTREFDLLVFFLTHRGTAFDRAELLARVWGWEFGDQSTVTVHVRRLREKVEVDSARPVRIATVWGVGYRYDGGA